MHTIIFIVIIVIIIIIIIIVIIIIVITIIIIIISIITRNLIWTIASCVFLTTEITKLEFTFACYMATTRFSLYPHMTLGTLTIFFILSIFNKLFILLWQILILFILFTCQTFMGWSFALKTETFLTSFTSKICHPFLILNGCSTSRSHTPCHIFWVLLNIINQWKIIKFTY